MILLLLAFSVGEVKGLDASGPYPAYAEKLELFGQLVGDWDVEVTYHLPDGTRDRASGEWHFGWVLEGRAIQDVWRVKRRPDDAEPLGYGTTLRVYDPEIDAWHVTWHGALNGSTFRFLARKLGGEIVMEGLETEELSRWIFSEITPQSFRWRAVASADGGKTWVTEQEMSARRRDASGALNPVRVFHRFSLRRGSSDGPSPWNSPRTLQDPGPSRGRWKLQVVLNWFEELKRPAPAKN